MYWSLACSTEACAWLTGRLSLTPAWKRCCASLSASLARSTSDFAASTSFAADYVEDGVANLRVHLLHLVGQLVAGLRNLGPAMSSSPRVLAICRMGAETLPVAPYVPCEWLAVWPMSPKSPENCTVGTGRRGPRSARRALRPPAHWPRPGPCGSSAPAQTQLRDPGCPARRRAPCR